MPYQPEITPLCADCVDDTPEMRDLSRSIPFASCVCSCGETVTAYNQPERDRVVIRHSPSGPAVAMVGLLYPAIPAARLLNWLAAAHLRGSGS